MQAAGLAAFLFSRFERVEFAAGAALGFGARHAGALKIVGAAGGMETISSSIPLSMRWRRKAPPTIARTRAMKLISPPRRKARPLCPSLKQVLLRHCSPRLSRKNYAAAFLDCQGEDRGINEIELIQLVWLICQTTRLCSRLGLDKH
jgi:hypothetical protein